MLFLKRLQQFNLLQPGDLIFDVLRSFSIYKEGWDEVILFQNAHLLFSSSLHSKMPSNNQAFYFDILNSMNAPIRRTQVPVCICIRLHPSADYPG